jgi:hypothetical protein
MGYDSADFGRFVETWGTALRQTEARVTRTPRRTGPGAQRLQPRRGYLANRGGDGRRPDPRRRDRAVTRARAVGAAVRFSRHASDPDRHSAGWWAGSLVMISDAVTGDG